MSREHIKELDLFRGIGAILVMLYHYTTRYEISFGHIGNYEIYVPWGDTAVSLFFMLSGFLIFITLREEDTALEFLHKRVIRLYPTYWAAIVLTTIFNIFLLPEKVRPFSTILINFTMVQRFFDIENVDTVYWTLYYELLFYIIIAIAISFGKRKNIKGISPIVWYILMGFVILFSKIRLNHLDDKGIDWMSKLIMPRYIHMFIVGIMLYYLYKNKKNFFAHGVILLCIYNHYINHDLEYTRFFILYILLFYLVVYGVRISTPLGRPIAFIAKISYPLYLTHQFIGCGIIRCMEAIGMTHEIFLIVPVAISILLAYLLHHFVEEPSARYFKRKRKMTVEDGC